MDYFKFYGRDIETLLAKTKIAHGRRVFCLKSEEKTIITLKDFFVAIIVKKLKEFIH